jgi:hypothetical protein
MYFPVEGRTVLDSSHGDLRSTKYWKCHVLVTEERTTARAAAEVQAHDVAESPAFSRMASWLNVNK